MIPLRIGFDMDGTLGRSVFGICRRLRTVCSVRLGRARSPSAGSARSGATRRRRVSTVAATTSDNRRSGDAPPRRPRGHRDRVWRAIEDTPNFWTTLKPLEERRGRAALRADRRAQLGSVFHHATSGDGRRDRAVADAQVARRARISHAQRNPVVRRPRQMRGGAASRLPHRRYAAELRRRAFRFVHSRRSFSSTRTIRLPTPARAVSASALRAAFTRCSILLVQATAARANPSLFEKLRKLVGWK